MKQRIENIKNRIQQNALSCGRKPESIRLVAVTKTVPIHRIREALEFGIDILGENYIQESQDKIKSLSSYPVSWHFIGHLQTNKAKYAVKLFNLIHTVDSIKLAHELNTQAQKINKIQQILIQVNIAGESSKSGVSPDELQNLIMKISLFKNLSIRGLMTVPPFFDNPEMARPFFAALRQLRDEIKKYAIPNVILDELSMGMTGDFEAAIQEGATLVRIGTAIFGERMV